MFVVLPTHWAGPVATFRSLQNDKSHGNVWFKIKAKSNFIVQYYLRYLQAFKAEAPGTLRTAHQLIQFSIV